MTFIIKGRYTFIVVGKIMLNLILIWPCTSKYHILLKNSILKYHLSSNNLKLNFVTYMIDEFNIINPFYSTATEKSYVVIRIFKTWLIIAIVL